MNQTLATFMQVLFTMLILSILIIGLCYQALKDKNTEFNNTIKNYQIQLK